jgi:flagellar biosynthesis protein FlhA
LAFNPGYVEEEIDGIETVDPYDGLPALWISESQRERAEAMGYMVVDAPAIIATHLTEVIKSHVHELVTRQDVQKLIDNVRETNTVLVDEILKLMTVGEVQKVLCNLLKEGVSVRDMVTILETLADNAAVRDLDSLTEYVRLALRRSITNKFFDTEHNTIITLDPELEQMFLDNIQNGSRGSFVMFDPDTQQRIIESLNVQITKLVSIGVQPIIVTGPIIRTLFKHWVEPIAPNLIVLSYNEIQDAQIEWQSVGMVSIA